MHLTKRKIESLEYDPDGPSKQVVYDDRLPNFGVRLNPGGSKSFVIRYRNEHGRHRDLTLGRFGRMTLQQGRIKAMEKFAEIDAGADPIAERNRANADTIDELVDAFIEKHCKPRRKTWKTDKRRFELHVLPHWKGWNVQGINRGDVSELHRTIGEDTPTEANRVVETIRTMFNFAQREGIVPDGFNPAKHVNKYEEKSRDRWLEPSEIQALAGALADVDNPYLRNYYWLLLLTATRRNELLETKWEHVDLDERNLELLDTKNGTDHTVPLSPPAVQLFNELPRQHGNPWVFCGRVDGDRIKEVNRQWRRIRKRAGLEDVVLHDFRRTAASWLAQSGYSELVIKQFLNHTVDGVTGIYARLRPEAVRGAVEEYGRQVMAARAGDEADVIPLAAARGER